MFLPAIVCAFRCAVASLCFVLTPKNCCTRSNTATYTGLTIAMRMRPAVRPRDRVLTRCLGISSVLEVWFDRERDSGVNTSKEEEHLLDRDIYRCAEKLTKLKSPVAASVYIARRCLAELQPAQKSVLKSLPDAEMSSESSSLTPASCSESSWPAAAGWRRERWPPNCCCCD